MIITAEPRSDQWNADDFVGGPRIFTVAGVKVGTAEQKYDIDLVEGEGRAWRPPLTVLRLLISAWGDDATAWTGRRVELFRDTSIKFGPDAVGGIRISRMSHLPNGKTFTTKLTSSRGKRATHTIEPLPDAPPPKTAKPPTAAAIIGAFDALGVTVEHLETKVGTTQDAWTAEHVATLAALGKAIKAGDTTVYEEFEPTVTPESQPELP